MDTLIHAEFLENEENYLKCTEFWDELISSLASTLSQEWVSWQVPGNNIPLEERDGDIIYDRKSKELNRGFSILQHAPDPEDSDGDFPFVTGWLKRYDEYQDIERLPEFQLVLSLVLSEGAVEIVKVALEKLFDPETSFAEMQDFVDVQLINNQIITHKNVRPFL